MYRYVFIILFFSTLIAQIFENQISNRVRQDTVSRYQLDPDIIHYRDEDELIEFIESIMETHLIPGLSISVVKENHIVWEKYFGYANIDENIFVDENTMFILSSISGEAMPRTTSMTNSFDSLLYLMIWPF